MAFLVSANTVIDNNTSILHTSFETITGTIQSTQVKIKASDGAAGDFFGGTVAVGSGRIVVGSRYDNDGGTGAGSAYIFDLNGTQIAKIKSSDSFASDDFGFAISVGSGRIVVGAPFATGGLAGNGAAYVFDLNGNQLVKLTASDGAVGDLFGFSVAVGSGRIVVGARNDDDNGTNSGSAYIFDLNGTQLAKIKPSDGGSASAFFGNGIAIGNGLIYINASNSDKSYIYDLAGNELRRRISAPITALSIGCGRIVVGKSTFGPGSGDILDLNGETLALINPLNGEPNDFFGASVAIGNSRVVAGAYGDGDNGSLSGATYVFDLNGNRLAKIKASDGAAGDYFGWSVAIGNGRIVVGSPSDDDLGSASGAAYIYKIPETHDGYFEEIIDTLRFR